jgi:hypothetical protein
VSIATMGFSATRFGASDLSLHKLHRSFLIFLVNPFPPRRVSLTWGG